MFNKNIMMLREKIKIETDIMMGEKEIDNKCGLYTLPRGSSKVVSILLASLSLSFSK